MLGLKLNHKKYISEIERAPGGHWGGFYYSQFDGRLPVINS